MRRSVTFWLLATLLASACSETATTSSSTSPTTSIAADSTTSAPDAVTDTTLPTPPEHHVAVRTSGGEAEFYDTTTDERFVPRGMNYNRWVTSIGGAITDDFLTVDHYDPETVEQDFAEMRALGFNTVRVLIETCHPSSGCMGTGPDGRVVNPDYLDNLADFLRIAKDHGLVVVVASNTFPDNSWWVIETARLQDAQFESANNEFLNPKAVPFYVDYWRQIVQGLVDRSAPTDVVLGYELRQEHHFHLDYAPLSLTDGLVTTANGNTYDMADQAAKDLMVDEGLVYWADLLRDEIRSIDPTALVTVGFFTPNAPHQVNGPDETRLVRTSYFIRNSEVDFVDLHHYPGNGVDDSHIWENFDILGFTDKPLILGEFGAIQGWWPDAAAGAAGVMALEVEACRVGFDGFLVWAWRGDLSEDIFWAADGDREIAAVVSPNNRPDPCEFEDFDFIHFNRSSEATVAASSEVAGFEATKVVDGSSEHWNAAEGSPQWIELSFASPVSLTKFDLIVAQSPAGRSVHELWVRVAGGELERVQVFDGVTDDSDVLTFIPETPLEGVELVRVVTTELGDLAPAWREVLLYSTSPPDP